MEGINLNKESAAVLLRCLSYGQVAISQAQFESGEEEVIVENINLLRKQTCKFLYRKIIEETVIMKKREKSDE